MQTAAPFTAEDLLEHKPALIRSARTLVGSRNDAEDLVQQTLLRALERCDHRYFRAGTNLRAWLVRMMRNIFYSLVSTRAYREVPVDPDVLAIRETVPARQEDQLRLRELKAALHRLPQEYQLVICLVAETQLPHCQIAMILGIETGSVKSRLCRARNQLKRELVADGMDASCFRALRGRR